MVYIRIGKGDEKERGVVMCLTNQTGGDKNTGGRDFRNKWVPLWWVTENMDDLAIVRHSGIKL